jgi:hypothetical protein
VAVVEVKLAHLTMVALVVAVVVTLEAQATLVGLAHQKVMLVVLMLEAVAVALRQ